MGDISGTKKFSVTATGAGTPTTVKATQAAPGAGSRIFVTDIAASSDKTGAIVKLVEDIGGTPVTKFQIQVGAGNFHHSFVTPIQITANKSATVEIDGTTVCQANIVGFITSH